MSNVFQQFNQFAAQALDKGLTAEQVNAERLRLFKQVVVPAMKQKGHKTAGELQEAARVWNTQTESTLQSLGFLGADGESGKDALERRDMTRRGRAGGLSLAAGAAGSAANDIGVGLKRGTLRALGFGARFANDLGENEQGTFLDNFANAMNEGATNELENASQGYRDAMKGGVFGSAQGFGIAGLESLPNMLLPLGVGKVAASAVGALGAGAGIQAGVGGLAALGTGFTQNYGAVREGADQAMRESVTPEMLRVAEKSREMFGQFEQEGYKSGLTGQDLTDYAYNKTIDQLGEDKATDWGLIMTALEPLAMGASTILARSGGGKYVGQGAVEGIFGKKASDAVERAMGIGAGNAAMRAAVQNEGKSGIRQALSLGSARADAGMVGRQALEESLQGGAEAYAGQDAAAELGGTPVDWGKVGTNAAAEGILGGIMGGGMQVASGNSPSRMAQQQLGQLRQQHQVQGGLFTQLAQGAQAAEMAGDAGKAASMMQEANTQANAVRVVEQQMKDLGIPFESVLPQVDAAAQPTPQSDAQPTVDPMTEQQGQSEPVDEQQAALDDAIARSLAGAGFGQQQPAAQPQQAQPAATATPAADPFNDDLSAIGAEPPAAGLAGIAQRAQQNAPVQSAPILEPRVVEPESTQEDADFVQQYVSNALSGNDAANSAMLRQKVAEGVNGNGLFVLVRKAQRELKKAQQTTTQAAPQNTENAVPDMQDQAIQTPPIQQPEPVTPPVNNGKVELTENGQSVTIQPDGLVQPAPAQPPVSLPERERKAKVEPVAVQPEVEQAAPIETQPNDVGRPSDGKPFASERAAKVKAKADGLTNSHDVVSVGASAFVIRPKQQQNKTKLTPRMLETKAMLGDSPKTAEDFQGSVAKIAENLPVLQRRVKEISSPPVPSDSYAGSIDALHGSKVEDLEFKPDWNAEENADQKSYFDNVFGDDVVYLGEDGQSWSTRDPDEADSSRMPFYPNQYNVKADFKSAFLLTPESAERLASIVDTRGVYQPEGTAIVGAKASGQDVVGALKKAGYDGLIVRGFDFSEDQDAVAVTTGIRSDVFQDQIVAFNPKGLQVKSYSDGRPVTKRPAQPPVNLPVRERKAKPVAVQSEVEQTAPIQAQPDTAKQTPENQIRRAQLVEATKKRLTSTYEDDGDVISLVQQLNQMAKSDDPERAELAAQTVDWFKENLNNRAMAGQRLGDSDRAAKAQRTLDAISRPAEPELTGDTYAENVSQVLPSFVREAKQMAGTKQQHVDAIKGWLRERVYADRTQDDFERMFNEDGIADLINNTYKNTHLNAAEKRVLADDKKAMRTAKVQADVNKFLIDSAKQNAAAQAAEQSIDAQPVTDNQQPYRLKPVRTYRTKTGKVGAEVKETRDAKGRLTYSYSGEWGAGSVDADSMRQLEAEWRATKRGHTIDELDGDSEPAKPADKPKQDPLSPAKYRKMLDGTSDDLQSLLSHMDSLGLVNPADMQKAYPDMMKAQLPDASDALEVILRKNGLLEAEPQKPQAGRLDPQDPNFSQAIDDFTTGRRSDVPSIEEVEAEKAAKPKADTVLDQFADNKIFTADKVAAARERLRKKLNQLNSGIDPELLVDGMMIAGAYIESGTRKFSDYAQKMIGDMGDNIKPYLLSFWEGARNYPNLDTTGMTDPAESKRLFDDLNKVVTEEMQPVVGEKAKPVGRREKKTGKPADRALRQDWGVTTGGMYPSINGWAESPDFPNAEMTDYGLKGGVKDAFLDDAKKYLQATATELEQMGYVAHTSKKGKIHLDSVSVNAAGVAVSGDVTMTLRHMETGASLYVSIGESSFHGMTPSTKNGIGILFRASMSGDKTASTGGGNNMWSPVALTASELSKMLDQHVQRVAGKQTILPQIEDGLSKISKPVDVVPEPQAEATTADSKPTKAEAYAQIRAAAMDKGRQKFNELPKGWYTQASGRAAVENAVRGSVYTNRLAIPYFTDKEGLEQILVDTFDALILEAGGGKADLGTNKDIEQSKSRIASWEKQLEQATDDSKKTYIAGKLLEEKQRLKALEHQLKLEAGATERQAKTAQSQIVTHTTTKGKELRGIVRTDLSAEEAKAIDPYTFKKDDGYFIRESRLNEQPLAIERATTKVKSDSGLIHDIPNKLMDTSHKLGDVVQDLAAMNTTGVQSDHEYAKTLLQTIAKLNPDVQVHVVSDLNNIQDKAIRANLLAGGFYVPEQNTVFVYPKSEDWIGSALELVNHELVHSVTEKSIADGLVSEETQNKLNALVKKIKEMLFDGYENLSENANDRLAYALQTNPLHEIIAAGVAESEVRQALGQIIGNDSLQQLDSIFTEISTQQETQNGTRNKSRDDQGGTRNVPRSLPITDTGAATTVQGVSTAATGSKNDTRSTASNQADTPAGETKSGGVTTDVRIRQGIERLEAEIQQLKDIRKGLVGSVAKTYDERIAKAETTLKAYQDKLGERSQPFDTEPDIKPLHHDWRKSIGTARQYANKLISEGVLQRPDVVNVWGAPKLTELVAAIDAALESVSAPVQTEPTTTQDNTNEPTELGQPSPRTLEGVPADSVQGAEGERPTGSRATESSGTDLSGDGRTGESGLQRTRSMGDGASDVPVSGGGVGAGSIRSDRSGGRAPQADVRQSGGDNTLAVVPAPQQSDSFVLTEQDQIGSGGAKTKFKGNVEAIRILKAVVAEGRKATREEQRKLAKFVGWGGLQQAFRRDDGSVANGWAKEVDELENLLTPDEYKAAVDSSIAAHYTSPEIVKGIWDAVKQLGFTGGRVLEPSMGSGNFFGMMPKDLRKSAQLHGVELDNITGHLAQQLYPEAKIKVMGFQDYAIPDGHFDLAIGNPPFGAIKITDASRPRISGLSLHNYFFAKSVDALAENGVLAMVVTNRLLDASNANDKARQYMAERTEFLGAIRLPNNAFAKNAGTEVTTDIIFLRKLTESERMEGGKGHAWVNVRPYTDKNGKQVPLNEYFHKNPSMMLGEFGAYGSMYTPDDPALVAREAQNTPELMAQAIAKLPKAIMADRGQQKAEAQHEQNIADIPNVKVGSMFVQDGQVYVRQPDQLGERQAEPVEMPSAKALDRVTGMTEIRDALNQLRLSQLSDDTSPESIEADRAALNKAYDAFVKRNGYLNSDANKRLFRDDPSWPQLSSLEDGFDKGISAAVSKNTGEQVREPSAKKAAIFQKRTQFPYTRIESVSNAKDGMVESLNRLGQLDIGLIAQLYGKDEQAIVKELGDLIYQDPVYGWVTADEYLSGNVKKKLAQAKDAVASGEDLQRNVEALEKVQPADIEAVDIEVRAGSHWIPSKHVVQFIKDTLAVNSATAHYNNYAASWDVTTSAVPESSQTSFGTIRANAATILIAALNGKQITIYDQLPENKTEVNAEATAAANEKVEQVKRAWADWIWKDDARRVELARIYNDTFNTTVQQRFDGAHLSLLGKVDDAVIKLKPHQADAVWRITQTPTTLLDHVVGAGKTFTMIGAIMELRRMGKSTKPMLVVPNHLVGQWAADFQKLYPSANILAANKNDFEKNNRKRLFARIATGDWDAVIVAHSSFGKVPLSPEEEAEFTKAEIKDMMDAEARIRSESGKDSRNAKDIAKRRMTLEEKLKKLMAEGRKDNDNLYWHELGVDSVFVDEAHEFKNLAFSSGMQRVAGLGNQKGSQKAFGLSMKIKSIKNRIAGSKIVFATGTPISNTMAEMYTMQRYLDLDAMQEQGLGHFDAWAKMFGQVVSDWELSPAGKYKMNSRFAKFVNMPELMQRYLSFADVINRDDINRQLAAIGQTLGTPKIKGDKPQNIVVERSDDQAGYIGEPIVDKDGNETYPQGTLVHRAENLPKKAEKGADNMLKIMSDARKAALDMRLIDPSLPDYEGSKTNEAVRRTVEIYKKWDADKGTQLIFCDLSTPKGAAAGEKARIEELIRLADQGDEEASEQLDKLSPDELDALNSDFSVYDDIKAKLIKSGIPEKEIAFIHDAKTELQKEELFGKVKSGRIRVLLGSTAKMGAGMNVQNRLVALHHLDAPWRPSDLEQREGRIIRQGNEFYKRDPEGFEIEILRYATKQTLDSRMWQTLESKARFIEQVRKGDVTSRVIEDVGGEAANAAEMKAASSGNPLILEEMSLRRELQNLESEKSRHNREQHRIKDTIRSLVRDQSSHDRNIAELTQDMSVRVPEKFEITIGKKTFKQGQEGARDQAGELLKEAAIKSAQLKQDFKVGSYGDFDLFVQHYSLSRDSVQFIATSPVTGGKYSVPFTYAQDSAAGLITKIGNKLKSIPEMLKAAEDQKARDLAEIPKLESQLKDWSKADELEAKREQHKSIIDQLKPKQKPEKSDVDSATGAEQEGRASRKQDGLSGQTVQQVRDLLTERFGADVIIKMLANGKLVIVQSDAALAKEYGTGIEGFYDPASDKTTLVADNLTPRTVIPTLLHEMGGHAGFQTVMRPETYAAIMRQFDKMVEAGNPLAVKAKQRAERAESNPAIQRDEYLPYLITEASIAQDKKGGAYQAVMRLIDRAVAAVRAWAFDKLGVRLKLNPNDIVALAERMVKQAANPKGASKGRSNADVQNSINPSAKSLADVRNQHEGKPTWMKAPNGKPTNLTEKQWLQVRTPEFKAWFGDWENDPANASKVVDDNGEPMVVYHASPNKDITVFDRRYKIDKLRDKDGVDSIGSWFSDNRDFATYLYGKNVYEAFLSLKDPIEYDSWDELMYEWRETHSGATARKKSNKDAMERFKKNNHWGGSDLYREEILGFSDSDGFVLKAHGDKDSEWHNQTAYVVAEPIQIKSATDNNGDFDGSNPDIRFSEQSRSRIDMHFKDVVKRTPELKEAAKKLQAGEITAADYDRLVNKYKPVEAYTSVPKPATREEALAALVKTNREKEGTPTKDTYYGIPSSTLTKGHDVGLRLDIPSYKDHGTWVVTVHEKRKNLVAGGAGKRIGYESVAAATDVIFSVNPAGALKIATGEEKNTIATMEGKWLPITDDQAYREAVSALKDPQWIQISMDPERHSYFYDRSNMLPVESADKVIQVGSLVLAKNPVYGDKTAYRFSRRDTEFDAAPVTPTNFTDRMKRRLREDFRQGYPAHRASEFIRRWLGTPLHLSLTEPQFKPVFTLIQERLNHVSAEASHAIEVAPEILGRRETFADFAAEVKNAGSMIVNGKYTQDMQAAAKVLFDGTLIDKKVYSDDELSAKGLTADQVKRYREMRAAINTSLDQSAKAHMSKVAMFEEVFTGEEIHRLHDQDLSVAAHREQVKDRIKAAIKGLDPLKQQDRLAKKRLEAALTKISDINSRLGQLKFEGYAPLMRFGQHDLRVIDKATGDTVLYEMFETKRERDRARDSLIEANLLGDKYEMTTKTKNPEEYKLFREQGINPETFALFSKVAGLDSDQAYQAYLKLATAPQSAMRRLIHRKGIAGFSENTDRVMAAFVISNARRSANMLYSQDIESAVMQIDDGELQGYAQKLVSYINDPVEEMAALRSFLFFMNMGFSLRYGLLNLTQPYIQTLPELTRYVPAGRATKIVTSSSGTALKSMSDDNAIPAEFQKDYQMLKRKGFLEPQNIWALQGRERGRSATTSAWDVVLHSSGIIAQFTETVNRRTAMIAALRTAKIMGADKLKAEGFDSAYDFAAHVIQSTQGVMNKGNRPQAARGLVGAPLFVFRTFSIQYVEQMIRMIKNPQYAGERDELRKALLLLMLILFGLAGATGLPFAKDLLDIFETGMSLSGNPVNFEREVQQVFGKEMAEPILYGAVNGFVFDMHGSTSMGDLLPATRMFHPDTSAARGLLEIGGATGGFLNKMGDSGALMMQGKVGDGVVNALPRFATSIGQGTQIATTGEFRTQYGNKLTDGTAMDAVLKIMDMNPSGLAQQGRIRMLEREDLAIRNAAQQKFRNQLIEAYEDGNQAKIREIRADIADWNKDNPQYPVKIDYNRSIKPAIKRRSETWQERTNVPEGMEWMQDLRPD